MLSTTTRQPDAWASAATAWMSTTFSRGFDGVSTQTKRVVGRIASASASASARSHVVISRPHGPSTWVRSRYVPPYTSSASTTWSPGRSVSSSVVSAAIPLANAKHRSPPSSEASARSNASRVGLPARP